MEYEVNRGVGRPVELFGLRSRYLFITGGGLMGCFLLFVLLNLCTVPGVLSAGIALGAAALLVYLVYHLSRTYGPHGLMKLSARRHRPDYLSHRKRVKTLLRK